MEIANGTLNSLNSVSSFSSTSGWLITILIFIGILITIWFLSKNFRQFIYGAIINIILILNYKLSRYIGISTTKNNFIPLKWICYIIGFIILSIIIGKIISKFKFIKKLEENFEEVKKDE